MLMAAKHALLACCIALVAGTTTASLHAAEDDFPGIQKLMSDDDFRRSGLGKLNKEELEALDGWLLRFTAGEAQLLQQNSEAVREVEKDFVLEARLVGGFSGWTGETLFTLDNGQVWQQRLSGRYPYRGPANPEVRIEKNWLGFYKMTLVDTGKSVGVSRRK